MFALFAMRSYPAGVRGLKQSGNNQLLSQIASYPAGVRGLKLYADL